MGTLILIPIAFLLSAPIRSIIIAILRNKNNEKVKIAITANSTTISALKNEYSNNLQILDKFSVVPTTFRNKFTVEYLISYLVNKRADNLKEAINIYEQEMRHRELIAHIQQLQQQQAYLAAEVSDAKYAAQRAETAARNAEYASWVSFF